MCRYFFHISYKGTNYRGWQKQAKVETIQKVIEDRLQSVVKSKVHCLGCGRTDAEVHAAQYFFHSDFKTEISSDLKNILNKILPADIVIHDIIPVEGTPHAQYSAISRTYDYFIHTSRNPFITDLSSYYSLEKIDFDQMKKAVGVLLNYKDFRAFCKTPDRHDSTICDVTSVKLFRSFDGNKIRFQITADKFLKSMIRIIVHNLIEVGTGKLTVFEFENFLKDKESPKYFNLAYPQGLYLSKVKYPFLDIKPNDELFTPVYNCDQYWELL